MTLTHLPYAAEADAEISAAELEARLAYVALIREGTGGRIPTRVPSTHAHSIANQVRPFPASL
jgi:hypothetical protein